MIRRLAVFAALVLFAACASHGAIELAGSSPSGSFGERVRVFELDSGVTATVVAPSRIDSREGVDLILYALPNGNTTAQTMGRKLSEGMDWHFDIQHIAAQTRALRKQGLP